MLKVLLVLAAVGLTVYALLDLGRTPRSATRYLPKVLWFLVVLVPVVGPAGWLALGRPRTPGRPRGTGGRPALPRRRGPVAPDDDPAFLRRLEEEAWRRRMEQRRQSGAPAPGTDAASGPARRPEPTNGGPGPADVDPVAEPTAPPEDRPPQGTSGSTGVQ